MTVMQTGPEPPGDGINRKHAANGASDQFVSVKKPYCSNVMGFQTPEEVRTEPSSAEDDTASLLAGPKAGRDQPSLCQPWRVQVVFVWCTAALVLSNVLTFLVAMKHARHQALSRYSQDFIEQVQVVYNSDVNRKLTLRRFPDFDSETSVYTASPNESVDQAWQDLGVNRPYFVLPKHLGPTCSLNSSHFQLPAGSSGAGGYPVVPEMIHQLHCLNMLREHLYYNHEYYKEKDARNNETMPERLTQHHLNHCVDALQARLLCTADIGLVPFFWRNTSGNAVPDFGRVHKCHDYKSVLEWLRRHSVTQDATAVSLPGAAVRVSVEEVVI